MRHWVLRSGHEYCGAVKAESIEAGRHPWGLLSTGAGDELWVNPARSALDAVNSLLGLIHTAVRAKLHFAGADSDTPGMKRALFIAYFLLAALPAYAAAPMACAYAFAQAEPLARMADALDRDMAGLPRALARLEIEAEGIEPLGLLGAGYSGSVFRVRYKGREYALKLFERSAFDEKELPAVLMQKHLGELGLAPKVEGVLDERQAYRFFQKHATRLSEGAFEKAEDARYGLLMELVDGIAYKRLDSATMKVSAAERERLLSDSERMVDTLHRLKIAPFDLDLMVTTDKRLLMIDLTSYSREGFNAAPMRRQFRQMTEGLLAPETAP
jgi:hypothetical protein